jgi:hypothetical protein
VQLANQKQHHLFPKIELQNKLHPHKTSMKLNSATPLIALCLFSAALLFLFRGDASNRVQSPPAPDEDWRKVLYVSRLVLPGIEV